jgi:hypothetical protein
MEKVVLVAFNGEPVCFAHVMLNALDMKERGYDVKVIIEGAATALVKTYEEPETPFAALFEKMREAELIECVCQACAHKMHSLESAAKQGLTLGNEMAGHPSLGRYIDEGYKVITF